MIAPVLLWLEELQSRIWNREELRPQLFRRVKITQAHYTALQKRLKELHSDRDLLDYCGTSNVLRVKLDFLRLLPQHPDDNDNRVDDDDDLEASNEDDPEIKSFFPSIISFLDLSTLELKEPMPHRLPSPLLLRQEYQDISDLIEKAHNDGMSVILSGQPGIGELFVSLSHSI